MLPLSFSNPWEGSGVIAPAPAQRIVDSGPGDPSRKEFYRGLGTGFLSNHSVAIESQ